MASAAIPAMANSFRRTSLEWLPEDEPAETRIQLTVWTGRPLLPKCNAPPLSPRSSEHAQRARQPQRYLRHIGDDAEEDQHGQKPRPHRDGEFGDAHLGDARCH